MMPTPSEEPGKFEFGVGTVVTQCVLCRHAVHDEFGRGCPSFPGGIPADIRSNQFDHRRPHPSESPMKGVPLVRFEPRPGVNPVAVAALYCYLDGLGSIDN